MNDLRERVKKALADAFVPWGDDWSSESDAAITAVIEALAAEAEAEPFMDFTGDWERSSSEGFADWLRAHLDAGRDGEAGDE